ncbi:hypothetical protein PRIPAC_85002 [Pristionchus pacificus]|uniref:Uncharacterized protein n=1 Tax=Pristionchus pacificus TaxID=54126 RepID=A0A2A6BL42_PRIPA|nr:hypothetical protein PRIPAC_85002 [Pristionchus pacificus]|eukprot:PDM66526.1 hypothetical protein PRIPAC_47943 [Pristionchus pacificus]
MPVASEDETGRANGSAPSLTTPLLPIRRTPSSLSDALTRDSTRRAGDHVLHSTKGSFRPIPPLPSFTHSFCSSLLALDVLLDYFVLAKPSCAFIVARSPSAGRNAL